MNHLGTRLEEMNQRAIQQGKLEGIEQGKLEGIEQGKLEGIEQGKLVGIEFVALQMIDKEVPVEEIQTYTGLTLEQIQELRRSN